MKITYAVKEEQYCFEGSTRTSYGIEVEAEGSTYVIFSLHDITPNRERLASFAELCNRLELSPTHLYDAVEDFLTG